MGPRVRGHGVAMSLTLTSDSLSVQLVNPNSPLDVDKTGARYVTVRVPGYLREPGYTIPMHSYENRSEIRALHPRRRPPAAAAAGWLPVAEPDCAVQLY